MLTLTNARLFDGHQMLPGRHSVTVEGTAISAIDGPPTVGGEVIDLQGMTLMPGLITSHFHPDFFRYSLADAMNGILIGKEFPPGVLMAMGVRNVKILLDSGFTGYLGAGCAHAIDAQLKIAIREGIIPGPRLRACSRHVNTTANANDPSRWWQRYNSPGLDVFADGPDGLRALVREEIRCGAETIKIFASPGHAIPGPRIRRNLALDELNAIVSAAHDRGALVRAHVCQRANILECIEAGVDILDHGDEMDEACIAAMVKHGTAWVPSLHFNVCAIKAGLDTGEGEFGQGLKMGRKMLPIAQQAGVRILIGDDYSGFLRDLVDDDPLDHEIGNYGRELAFYGGFEGLEPIDILRWCTSNPGHYLTEAPERVGIVAAGAKADLIVIDGDPLADLSIFGRPETHLKAVIADGAFSIDRLGAQARKVAA